MMPETVLVTGGTGFVGGWCVVELLKRGYTVRTTVRNLAKESAVHSAVASVIDPGDRLTGHRVRQKRPSSIVPRAYLSEA